LLATAVFIIFPCDVFASLIIRTPTEVDSYKERIRVEQENQNDNETPPPQEQEEGQAKSSALPEEKVYTVLGLLSVPSFWLDETVWLFSFTSGFGVKFLVAPFMLAFFNSTSSAQQWASFIFLMAYVIARFGLGVLMDGWIQPHPVMLFGTSSQSIGCFCAGAIVFSGSTSYQAEVLFIFFIAIIGMGLAAVKVASFVLVLKRFGAKSFTTGLGLTLIPWGIASMLGPICGWASLTPGKVDISDKAENPEALSWSGGTFFMIAGGTSAMATVGHMYWNTRPLPAPHNQLQTSIELRTSETSSEAPAQGRDRSLG